MEDSERGKRSALEWVCRLIWSEKNPAIVGAKVAEELLAIEPTNLFGQWVRDFIARFTSPATRPEETCAYVAGQRRVFDDLMKAVTQVGFHRATGEAADALLQLDPQNQAARDVLAKLEKRIAHTYTKYERQKAADKAADARELDRRSQEYKLNAEIRNLTRIIWWGDLIDPWTRDRQKFWAERGTTLTTGHDVEPPRLPSDETQLWCVGQDYFGLVHIIAVNVHVDPPYAMRPVIRRDGPISYKSVERWRRWSGFLPFFNTPGKAWNAAEIALKEKNLEEIAQRLGI